MVGEFFTTEVLVALEKVHSMNTELIAAPRGHSVVLLFLMMVLMLLLTLGDLGLIVLRVVVGGVNGASALFLLLVI